MAKYLITGGAGFIGSHLCDHLIAQGNDVVVFDNLSTGKSENLSVGADLVIGDIRETDALAKAMEGADGCFHLAAIASVEKSNEHWIDTHSVNLTGTISVFEAAKKSGCIPVVYASSAAVYGAAADLPITESAEKEPMTAYGADKYACELHAVPALQVHGVPSTALRLFNVYGPRQDPKSPYSGVISIFANRMASGKGVEIHGDGKQTRDFIYVEDVCAAFLSAMNTTSSRSRTFNVCTGTGTSILHLAEKLAEITQYEQPFTYSPARTGDIPKSVGDGLALEKATGFSPSISLDEGLRRLVSSM